MAGRFPDCSPSGFKNFKQFAAHDACLMLWLQAINGVDDGPRRGCGKGNRFDNVSRGPVEIGSIVTD